MADEATQPPGEPLQERHRARIEPLLRTVAAGLGVDCPSEYSFNNLLLFNAVHGYRWIDGRWPAIAGLTYDGARHLMPLFELAKAPTDVLRRLLSQSDALYPLTQAQGERLDPRAFDVVAERADSDYLYRAQAFLSYPGRALQNKRRQLQRLLARHRLVAHGLGPAQLDAALQVLAGWLADKSKTEGDADDTACRQALRQAGRFGLRGFVHFADGRPAGFLMAEPLCEGVWVVRFAKGLDEFGGIYPYMFQHFCCAAGPTEVRWLNFEQDLGHAGFRQSKLSYRPERLLLKVRAYPKCG